MFILAPSDVLDNTIFMGWTTAALEFLYKKNGIGAEKMIKMINMTVYR
ncbi:MAG: hypothetical protein K1W20_14150 [Lachnospiraceae bacterium]